MSIINRNSSLRVGEIVDLKSYIPDCRQAGKILSPSTLYYKFLCYNYELGTIRLGKFGEIEYLRICDQQDSKF